MLVLRQCAAHVAGSTTRECGGGTDCECQKRAAPVARSQGQQGLVRVADSASERAMARVAPGAGPLGVGRGGRAAIGLSRARGARRSRVGGLN